MFTKDELKIKPNGYVDLAAAIIRQWQLDGKPANDADGIRMWSSLLDSHHRTMINVRHGVVHEPDAYEPM
jgi:hypothetical protein